MTEAAAVRDVEAGAASPRMAERRSSLLQEIRKKAMVREIRLAFQLPRSRRRLRRLPSDCTGEQEFVGRQGHSFSDQELKVLSSLAPVNAIDLRSASDIFDVLDADGDGLLSRAEIRGAATNARVQAFVERSECATLRALLARGDSDDRLSSRAMRRLDRDGSGAVDRKEWSVFVTELARERVRYLKVLGLCQRRCYWGRGAAENAEERRGVYSKCYSCWIALVLADPPEGFVEDLAYFTRNHHPFFALWSRDRDHPYTRSEHAAALLVMNAYAFFGAVLVEEQHLLLWQGYVASFLVVTLPLLIIDTSLFYALACPCLRFESQGRDQELKWRRTELALTCLGHLALLFVLAIACAFAFYGALACARDRGVANPNSEIDGISVGTSFVVGIVGFWVAFPAKLLLREFNLAAYSESWWYRACCCEWLGFGQWSAERAAARNHDVAAAAAADGDGDGDAPVLDDDVEPTFIDDDRVEPAFFEDDEARPTLPALCDGP